MSIEMSWPRVAGFFQELNQVEHWLYIFAAETQILIIAAGLLIVQVDVEEFFRVYRLGNPMIEVETTHVLMGNFRIDANDFRMVQRFNEGQHVSRCSQVYIATGFVRFGFQGEFQVVLLVERIFTQEIYSFAIPL